MLNVVEGETDVDSEVEDETDTDVTEVDGSEKLVVAGSELVV